jgi:hypothetical protein
LQRDAQPGPGTVGVRRTDIPRDCAPLTTASTVPRPGYELGSPAGKLGFFLARGFGA